MDTVEADWNAEARESAENYLEFGHFSYDGLYKQLTSEYGENFTPEQAQYAVDTVDADWNAEAVEAAESYQELMPMSGAELLNQLRSEEHTSELQSRFDLVCRLLLEKKNVI